MALTAVALVALAALVALVFTPWRVEASLKSAARDSVISLAGGLEVAGFSASAAAILDGPGVVVLQRRAREIWRRPISRVSPEALLEWLEARRSSAPAGPFGRLAARLEKALVARTDFDAVPGLGAQLALGLRETSVHGALNCGFSDPALTGKTAAWLFPIAGVLAPLGSFDLSFDWSGRTVLDGSIEASFRLVPARAFLSCVRFAWHHVHLRRKVSTASSPVASPDTA